MTEKTVQSILIQALRNGVRAGRATPAGEQVPRCSICGGSGWRILETPHRHALRCECVIAIRGDKLLAAARIPRHYDGCALATYKTVGKSDSVQTAKLIAERFIAEYPSTHKGLLLIGPMGVGKTHLAIGILKELIGCRGARGLFIDYRELLKEIQNSYNPAVQSSELAILRPIFQTEILVLDDLGSMRPTEWVWDTVSLILNSRYNEDLTTIITTNFENKPAQSCSGAERAGKNETLGDRIGERMRSRLHEMCRIVGLDGKDMRKIDQQDR